MLGPFKIKRRFFFVKKKIKTLPVPCISVRFF